VKKIGKAGMCQQRKRRELTNHQKLVKETGMIGVQEVHGPWRTLPQATHYQRGEGQSSPDGEPSLHNMCPSISTIS